MKTESRTFRRFRSALPGDGTEDAGSVALRRSDDSAVATGNSFHPAREKDRLGERSPPPGIPPPVASGGPFPGRLNLFQRAMLDWRDQHPYSAVHAVRIARPLDEASLTRAIAAELVDLGLTGLELDRVHGRYAWRGGPAHPVLDTLAPGADWQATLAQAFERQLNVGFPRDGRLDPFRFFAMPVEAGFFLGLGYDHFIAGGDSIVALLNAIADRYAGRRERAAPLQRYPRTHARLFLRHPWRVLRALARMPGLAASCRRTVRPRYRSIEDGHNGFTFFMLDPAEFRALRDAAKNWGVTLNDALMALLLLALDAVLPTRDTATRRRELAVASIINLCGEHREDPRRTFGQFLSSFRVSHPVPRGVTLRELALDVHYATARIKRERLYLATLVAMAGNRIIGRFQGPKLRMGIYAKSYPVGAGVSSLNVNALWQAADGSDPPLYIRGVPTGPTSPLVVAVTTSGDTLCAGVSYRTAAFVADAIDAIRADIRDRIRALA
ncbi:MAG TPA: hypothetical protein VF059_08285 [Casimicrobiaceae bacterium]